LFGGKTMSIANGKPIIAEEIPGSLIYRSPRLAHFPEFVRRAVILASKIAAGMRPVEWVFFDAGAAALALVIGYETSPRAANLHAPIFAYLVFPLAIVLAANITGLYERQILLSRLKLLITLFVTAALALSGFALFSNIIVYKQIGRYVLAIAFGAFLVISAAPRLIGHYAARLYRMRVLLVGDPDTVEEIARILREENRHQLYIGFCGDNGNLTHGALGHVEDIPRVCQDLKIDEIVITRGYMNRADVLDRCFEALQADARVLDEASFHEEVLERVPVSQINESWFYSAKIGYASPLRTVLKRLVDLAIAAVGLVLTAPIFAILWLLVKTTSPGPALYSQTRCGRFGKPFRMYKMRSMRMDAERNGAQWAVERDPRVTPLGRFLRKSRLDEIPQFWNILKGDMSFVGPRPERPEFVREIENTVQYFGFRHLVRPGITGFAQIRYRYGSSIEDAREKLQYDLYYIKNWSLLLDLQIILRTISALMRGAR
jgi:exopolysaccharide biosynthesis polyprenyl glycosylphosphotransferase